MNGFLDKNKDSLADDVNTLFSKSSIELVRSLFSDVSAAASPNPKTGSAPRKLTVATNFKNQLAELMSTLGSTAPHYVRCLKPNTLKQSNNFDDNMVLAQLR